jgi:hypothetical protein
MAAWSEGDGARSTSRNQAIKSVQPVEALETVRDEPVEFANCLREGFAGNGGQEALEVVVAFEAILESVRNRRVVNLEIRARLSSGGSAERISDNPQEPISIDGCELKFIYGLNHACRLVWLAIFLAKRHSVDATGRSAAQLNPEAQFALC